MSNSSQDSDNNQSFPKGKGFGRKSAGGIAVVALVAVYSFVQPKLNEKFGLNLPGLRQAGGRVVVDDAGPKKPTTNKQQPKQSVEPTNNANTATKPRLGSGPLADKMRSAKTNSTSGAKVPASKPSSNTPAATPKPSEDATGLRYGILREVSPDRFISPAGLSYLPGSAEGHRLEHLRRHTKDMVSRPIHGVFDGDMAGALKTIDQAYERAKKNQRTTKKTEDGRTIYTVDMGKRVGFIGGRAGQRKRNPMARRVRLVLDGTKVVTAFPTD